ncbi:MAG: hypothetical protein PF447_09945, partial [Spirochaetaceae bacterium]|nr:hypothetical protein [Spirochaetaceae bacterium]
MNPLIIKIRAKEKPLLFYGFTPPKRNNDIVKNIEISQRRMVRLEETPIDGLVIYDIQDESSRHKAQRPFPFLPTLEPMEYYNQY